MGQDLLKSLSFPDKALFRENIRGIVKEFDELEITNEVKPKVGLVGEILVKFHPTANNNVVDIVEAEGAEAVVPSLTDFLLYCLYDKDYHYKYLAGSKLSQLIALGVIKLMEYYRTTYREALTNSKRFYPPKTIEEIAQGASTVVSLGHHTEKDGC